MLLTLQTKTKTEIPSFQEILNNPYMTNEDLKTTESKRITIDITDEYAKKLNKNCEHINKYLQQFKTLLNELPEEELKNHYHHFTIPKRSNPNKRRQIDAPDLELSNIQYKINHALQTINIMPHNAAHAYVKERSTVTAMKTHQKNRSRWFLQIDLKNFFPSFNAKFIETELKKVYPFALLPKEFIDCITKYALIDDSMPQGTVLSPYLANMCMVSIDNTIQKKLENEDQYYIYTRYADDITISSKKKFNEKEIIKLINETFSEHEAPFTINKEKTRFGSSSGKNYHLGMNINRKNELSLGFENNKKFRAMLHQFAINHSPNYEAFVEYERNDIQKMLGLISYYRAIEPKFVNKQIAFYNNKFNTDIETIAKEFIK